MTIGCEHFEFCKALKDTGYICRMQWESITQAFVVYFIFRKSQSKHHQLVIVQGFAGFPEFFL